jgi:hypothetical protein
VTKPMLKGRITPVLVSSVIFLADPDKFTRGLNIFGEGLAHSLIGLKLILLFLLQ